MAVEPKINSPLKVVNGAVDVSVFTLLKYKASASLLVNTYVVSLSV